MGSLITKLSESLLRLIPIQQRTRWIGILQILYAIIGLTTGKLDADQAAIIATTAIGLLTARSAVDKVRG